MFRKIKRGIRGVLRRLVEKIIIISPHAFLGPRLVQINPTVLCNHRCIMCWMTLEDSETLRKKAKDDLTFDQYRRFIDEFPYGVKNIMIIGGGEPLVHKDAFLIIRYLKEEGYRVNLHTNGSLLDPDQIIEIVEKGWDVITYSLHASNEDTYRSIHKADKFKKVRDGIFLIRDLKEEKNLPYPTVALVFVIQRENYRELSQMLDFAKEAKTSTVSFSYVIPYNPETALSENELEELFVIVEDCLNREYPFSHNLQGFYDKIVSIVSVCEGRGEDRDYEIPGTMCLAGFFVTNVTTDGFIRPCCFSDEYMGNIKEESFKKIWNSPKYRKFRKELKKGKFRDYCYSNRCSFEWIV